MDLDKLISGLADFEPTQMPVISLYLNTQPNQHGRDDFDRFLRKEFRARARTFAQRSPERESFDRDRQRIEAYLRDELQPSANGVVIFACAGAGDFFKALQLEAPIDRHRLYVSDQPHLYPLARLSDQYRRYAALITDTNSARLFVFGLGASLETEEVQSTKTNRTSVGGWSQARYQRHVENYHLHHAKEVVEALERLVREESIEHVVLAGDEAIIPTLREQMPQHLNDKVVDVLRLDVNAPEHEILRATLETMREQDARDDAEKVARMLEAYRGGGLAVAGARAVLEALEMGQVDELLITASARELEDDAEETDGAAPGADGDAQTRKALVADELVTQAQQTAARVTFIEDAALLADVGGVGATLRYRIEGGPQFKEEGVA